VQRIGPVLKISLFVYYTSFFPLEEIGIREQNALRLSLIRVKAIHLAVINTEIIYTEDGGRYRNTLKYSFHHQNCV
jgi:hypothetical protein